MKFSVITPSFDQGRFIRDCIESVKQNAKCRMPNAELTVEHIVIDAGSTDETVSILKSYPHLQWVSEPDKGQTDAINKGFRKATGDWLMWLNADDYLKPGALAKVAAFLQQHPAAEVIYGDCDFVSETGELIRRKKEFGFDFEMLLFYGCYIPSTATFYKRKLIDGGFLLDDSYKVCMDFEYYMRMACAGRKFAHLPQALACFRWHETNASLVYAGRRYEERLRVQREALQKLGRPKWLGGEKLLQFLFRIYQMKRVLRRLLL